MPNRSKSVGVVYWGRRGGGGDMTIQLLSAAEAAGYKVTASVRPSVSTSGIHNPFPRFRNLIGWLAFRNNCVKEFISIGLNTVIIPMASPWDLFMGRKLRKNGIEVVRIIHDASPHPGEYFPPQFWIRLLCKDASRVITLSEYVASELMARYKVPITKIRISKIPIPSVDKDYDRDPFNLDGDFILFIGRGKKYKGLKEFLHIWPKIGNNDSRLVVAGENHKVPKNSNRLVHIDQWLSKDDLNTLVAKCKVLVLPYIEASQSGLIPIAHAFGKPVVVNSVGGLPEQVIDGLNGYKCHLGDSFSDLVNLAFRKEWSFEVENPSKSQYELFLTCISDSS